MSIPRSRDDLDARDLALETASPGAPAGSSGVTSELERGLAGLRRNDHLAFLYEDGAQQLSVLTAFFRSGLARGERCVYVSDEMDQGAIVDRLQASLGVRPAPGGPLTVIAGSRFGQPGAADACEVLCSLERDAKAPGHTAVRIAIEMAWALGPVAVPGRLTDWEAGLHRHLTPASVALAICHYDRRRFSASVLEAALRSHPTVILGDQVYPNVYYAPHLPDALRVGDGLLELPVVRRAVKPLDRQVLHMQVARAEAEMSERRAAFLAEASIVLASSLDLETIFQRVARLAVPTLADWFVVDVIASDGILRRVATAHGDPAPPGLGDSLADRQDVTLDGAVGPIAEVMRTGRSRVMSGASDELRAALGRDAERLGRLRDVQVTSCMIVPLLAGDHTLGAITFATAESGRRYAGGDLGFAEALGQRAALAVRNAQLYAESERRRREAESLAELGRLVSGTLEPVEVARRIADSVRVLLRGRSSTLFRLDPGGELRVAATSGESPTYSPDLIIPPGAGAAGLAVRRREPVATSDVLADPRLWIPRELEADIVGDWHRAVLAVPLIVKGDVTGVLRVTDVRGRVFRQEEIRLVQAFAGQAALAQENSRLYAQAEELAAERERVRVAQELHDTLSQVLFSVGLKLDWCLRRLPHRSPVRHRLGDMRREAGFVMEQVRRLIGRLSPPEDERFLPDGLQALVRHFCDLTGIGVELHAEGDWSRLDAQRQQVLRKVLQEALTNVAKHSRAATARLALVVRGEEVVFEVVDDGVGPLDPPPSAGASRRGHFGLRQMRERLEAIGGRLESGPRPTAAGFRLAGGFPLAR
jgi:signal transduction histidine kinase